MPLPSRGNRWGPAICQSSRSILCLIRKRPLGKEVPRVGKMTLYATPAVGGQSILIYVWYGNIYLMYGVVPKGR